MIKEQTINSFFDGFISIIQEIEENTFEETTDNDVDTNLPVKFLTIKEVANLMRMSEKQTRKMFSMPDFPSCDYGKSLIVEESALKEFFSKKRLKLDSPVMRN